VRFRTRLLSLPLYWFVVIVAITSASVSIYHHGGAEVPVPTSMEVVPPAYTDKVDENPHIVSAIESRVAGLDCNGTPEGAT
jgi:hypothetical protein